jgi:outer membrane protein assembly factor BamB
MIDERRLLERAAGTVPPREHVMDALHRRRERKLRNRRLGALVLAACLTVALVVGVVQAIHGAERKQPATPSITPGNAASLQEIGADHTFPQQGFRTATGDGILAMGTSKWRQPRPNSGQVVAYPFPCAGAEASCAPLWRAPIEGSGMPTIADGSVYVLGLHGHTVYSFPSDCASDGSVCEPTWTASFDKWGSIQPPLVVDDAGSTRVFVGTYTGVLGFDADCATEGRACPAATTISTKLPVRVLTYADGLLYVGLGPAIPSPHNYGNVLVYATACLERHPTQTGGCIRWSRPVGQVWDLVTDATNLYVGINGGSKAVQAYPLACVRSGATCSPTWIAETDCCTFLTVADGVVYADDETQHVFAFSTTCSSDGGSCEPLWTSRGVLGLPFVDFEGPVVTDDLVFVGGDEGWLYAFDRACSGLCEPSSRIFIADQNGIPGIWDARVSGERLYVAAEDGLHVFAPGVERAVEMPSAGEAPIFYTALALVCGTLLALNIRRRRKLRF